MLIERYQTDELFNKLEEAIGIKTLANEMYAAMSTDQACEILEFIAKNYDIKN